VNASAGDGGTATIAPKAGQIKCTNPQTACSTINDHQGGGGGSAGKFLAVTKDGEIRVTGSPTLSVVITQATLLPQ
jgi:hypothetical protein